MLVGYDSVRERDLVSVWQDVAIGVANFNLASG